MGNFIIDLSIIIPSFRRSNLLYWGLESLSYQSIKSNYEIIVLNDGIPDKTEEVCNNYKNKLNIKYIFTGQRNTEKIEWRIPGFAINIGARLAMGKNLILTCPEIWIIDNCIQEIIDLLNQDSNRLVISEGKDDRLSIFLNHLNRKNNKSQFLQIYNNLPMQDAKGNTLKLNTKLPFFLGLNKQKFIDIGGYDEEFIGFCFDDSDIVDRLLLYGCYYYKTQNKIIHLFHRRLRAGIEYEKNKLWIHNQNLYNQKRGQIIRNIGKEWGKI